MRCHSSLTRYYSIFLSKYFFIFLILTPVFVGLCALLSFLPSVGPDLPDFSKPTKGFEPRGTPLMKRVITRKNIKKYLECNPNANSRVKRSLPQSMCYDISEDDAAYYAYYAVKTVYKSDGDMMNARTLQDVCNLEKSIVRSTVGFKSVCRQNNGVCCPSYSLGNYVGAIRNRASCQDITTEDVAFVKELLRNCSTRYFSGELDKCLKNYRQQNCSEMHCTKYAREMNNIFTYTVDKDFMRSSNVLRNTMVLTPVYYDDDTFYEDVYNNHFKHKLPERYGIELVAFNFPDFKFDQFNRQLLLDAIFPGIGLILIALILMIYTHSILVMLFTVFSVISSIIISYFFYHFVFRLTFFPFLNVTTFIFLVGIGADDAFVLTDVWKQAKLSKPGGTIVDLMEYTLNHAALSMLVTSLTTSSAFYANVVSDITAIRLFGIFAGTSIIINFAFMVTWLPAGIILLEKWCNRSVVSVEQNIPLGNVTDNVDNGNPDNQGDENLVHETSQRSLDRERTTVVHSEDHNQTNHSRFYVCKVYVALRSKCSQFMTDLFGCWIPKCLSLFPLWLVALTALGIGMLCAVLVSPGLQRPKSSEFQLFSSSHPLEQYDLKYKEKFRADSDKDSNFWVYVFFGIKPEDNGNYFDPSDYGTLTYDNSFNITSTESHQWLLKLCSHIRNQTFFNKESPWTCLCSASATISFPYPPGEVEKCVKEVKGSCNKRSRLLYDKYSNLKALQVSFPTNVPDSNEYATVDTLWNELQEFSRNVLDTAPAGLQNGWAVTSLQFYALQKNLGSSTITSLGVSLAISFAVMLATSMNWVISIYAILTIIFILSTTVGTLVLVGWELNILESIVISVAVGLSVDFTLHYGVAYNIAREQGRIEQVKYALSHIGPAVTLASITTFIAGVFMMFSTVLVYFQLGQFLTLVMAVSWVYATFFFMSLCYFAGPVGYFAQINSKKCLSCQVSPHEEDIEDVHL